MRCFFFPNPRKKTDSFNAQSTIHNPFSVCSNVYVCFANKMKWDMSLLKRVALYLVDGVAVDCVVATSPPAKCARARTNSIGFKISVAP